MLATGGMLDKVRRGDLGFMKRPNVAGLFAQAEALLVMNQGPSEELERSLRCALEHSTPAQKKTAVRFDEWVRGQAQTAD
jgi:hypothetical protein